MNCVPDRNRLPLNVPRRNDRTRYSLSEMKRSSLQLRLEMKTSHQVSNVALQYKQKSHQVSVSTRTDLVALFILISAILSIPLELYY